MLAWRLSNTMDASFCMAALEEELARFGRPEIFNTDQGSQFTSVASVAFTGALAAAGIRISMDGRGRWMGAGLRPADSVHPLRDRRRETRGRTGGRCRRAGLTRQRC